MDIGNRIFRLLKAATNDKLSAIDEIIEQGSNLVDDFLSDWEKKHGLYEDSQKTQNQQSTSSGRSTQGDSTRHHYQETKSQEYKSQSSPYPKQMVDDLQLFGLTPPVTLSELKKVRNQEIKKFHPDKFLNEPEKMETAKRILQIYNAAYERLEPQIK